MTELSEAVLRSQLASHFPQPLEIAEICLMPDDIDRFGQPFLARDRLKTIYRGRLRGVQLHASLPDSRADMLEASLKQLDAVASDEPLYSWTVLSGGKRIGGISTTKRLIIVIPETPNAT